jgi:glycosyltransferase involved in cell wall biosynthesis
MSNLSLRSKLNLMAQAAMQVGQFALNSYGIQVPDWIYVGDGADWVINQEGSQIVATLKQAGVRAELVRIPIFQRAKVIHFGTLGAYKPRSHRHRIVSDFDVVTCFHGNYGINSMMDNKLDSLISNISTIERLIIANSTMHKRFVDWGVPQAKLSCIPVSVDIEKFSPASIESKMRIRDNLEIPPDAFVIGSFQKDGVGWGGGNEPKLIKGPDIFCDVIERISKEVNLHVLLTGPARGYVINRLQAAKISYSHRMLHSYYELPDYYRALDCYLMCSREEGGPKSVPEALATGVPIVATRTGLASDVEAEFNEGWFCDVDDHECLTSATLDALTNESRISAYAASAPKYAERFSWQTTAAAHLQIFREITQ